MTTPNSLGKHNNSGANLFGGGERFTPKNTGQSMAHPQHHSNMSNNIGMGKAFERNVKKQHIQHSQSQS